MSKRLDLLNEYLDNEGAVGLLEPPPAQQPSKRLDLLNSYLAGEHKEVQENKALMQQPDDLAWSPAEEPAKPKHVYMGPSTPPLRTQVPTEQKPTILTRPHPIATPRDIRPPETIGRIAGLGVRGGKRVINAAIIKPIRKLYEGSSLAELDTALALIDDKEFGEYLSQPPEKDEKGRIVIDFDKINEFARKAKQRTRERTAKAMPGFKIPAPETPSEKTVDVIGSVVGGVGGFIGRLVLLKRMLGGGGTIRDTLAWELENQFMGGQVGKGAAIRGSLGAIAKIPTGSVAGKVAKVAAQSGLFSTVTAISGGNKEDIIVSALIPAVFNSWHFIKQKQYITNYERGLRQGAYQEYQNRIKRGMPAPESAAHLKADQRLIVDAVAKAKQTIYRDNAFATTKEKWELQRQKALKMIASGKPKQVRQGNDILDFIKRKPAEKPSEPIETQIKQIRQAAKVIKGEKFKLPKEVAKEAAKPAKTGLAAIAEQLPKPVTTPLEAAVALPVAVTPKKGIKVPPEAIPRAQVTEAKPVAVEGDVLYHYTDTKITEDALKPGQPHEQNYFGEGVYLTEKGQFPGKYEHEVRVPKALKILDLTNEKAYEDFRSQVAKEIDMLIEHSGESLYDDFRRTAVNSANESETNNAIRKAVAKLTEDYDAIKAPYFGTTAAQDSFELIIKREIPIAHAAAEAAKPAEKPKVKPGFVRVGTVRELKKTLNSMDLGFKKTLQIAKIEPTKIVEKRLGKEVAAKVITGIHETDVARVEFREQKVDALDVSAGQLADKFAKYPDSVLDDLMATRGHGLKGKARIEQVKAFVRLPKELKTKEVRRAIQEIADRNYKYLRKVAGDDINYVADYFYGIYKSPKKVDKFLDYWRTTKKYIKEKVFPTYADARAYGLEIRDPNPIHNLQSEYIAIAHLKGMQDMKADLLRLGKDIYIWDKADAPLKADKVYDPVFKDVMVDPDLAKLINNLISTNKISKIPILNALREVNNFLRTIKFVGSAFHLLSEAKQSVADSGYVGFYKPTARRGLTAGFHKNDPIFRTHQYKDYLGHGGGHRYSIESQAARWFKRQVDQMNKSGQLLMRAGGLPLKIPVGFVDWMFQKYIPKVKYAKFLDTRAAKEKKLGRPLTSAEKIDIIKEQQNFYGMMNERLFGRSGTVTTLTRFYFMSPGYAEGNYRTMVKAALQWGQGKEGFRASRSRSNIINSWIISGALATIATVIMTGKWPKKPETLDDVRDLMKIDTGKKDDRDRRIMIDMLTYDKDYWNVAFNILRLKPGKALELSVKRIGGMKATTAEIIHDLWGMAMGKTLYDWKGDEVFHLTDSFLQKVGKVVVHEIKRAEPISVSVFKQSRRRQIDTVVAAMESLAGLRPAKTEADIRIQKLRNKMFSLRGQREELTWQIANSHDPIQTVKDYNKTVNSILDSPIMPDEMRKYWTPKLLIDEKRVYLWMRYPVKKMTSSQIKEAIRVNTYKRAYKRKDGITYRAGHSHKGKEERVAELRGELKKRKNR